MQLKVKDERQEGEKDSKEVGRGQFHRTWKEKVFTARDFFVVSKNFSNECLISGIMVTVWPTFSSILSLGVNLGH